MAALILLLALSGILASASAGEGCTRMTAALSLDGNTFIFFGQKFVRLDYGMNQVEEGDSYQSFGIPYPDAAFVFSVDHTLYGFSDQYYFSRWTNYSPVDAYIFGGQTFGDFFRDGLDAAGNFNGMTMFYKGCKFFMAARTPYPPMSLPRDVPCNLDAALTVGEELWLMKDDQMWVISEVEHHAEGPFPIADRIHLTDIKLCAAEGTKKKE